MIDPAELKIELNRLRSSVSDQRRTAVAWKKEGTKNGDKRHAEITQYCDGVMYAVQTIEKLIKKG